MNIYIYIYTNLYIYVLNTYIYIYMNICSGHLCAEYTFATCQVSTYIRYCVPGSPLNHSLIACRTTFELDLGECSKPVDIILVTNQVYMRAQDKIRRLFNVDLRSVSIDVFYSR